MIFSWYTELTQLISKKFYINLMTYLLTEFTIEEEFENKINFLDITISKQINNMQVTILKKPTATHKMIPIFPMIHTTLWNKSYPLSDTEPIACELTL